MVHELDRLEWELIKLLRAKGIANFIEALIDIRDNTQYGLRRDMVGDDADAFEYTLLNSDLRIPLWVHKRGD